MKRLVILPALVIMLAFMTFWGGQALGAGTIYVDDDGVECPGAGYATIQAAVDATIPGDTVIVCAGTYNETVTIRSDDNSLDLVGKGATINGGTSSTIVLQGGAHHISITGFDIISSSCTWGTAGIDGWTNTSDPDYAAMHDITIHHNDIYDNYDGINIGAWVWWPYGPPAWTHYNITIQHNQIYDNCFRGIDWWAVSDSTIAHNVIQDNAQDGITWVGISDSTATHNHINGNNTGYPTLLGVGLSINEGSTGNTVVHNDVTNNVNLGILLTGWNIPTTGNTFVHNDARNNTSWDIREFTTSGGNPAVFGNTWVKNEYDDAAPDPPQ